MANRLLSVIVAVAVLSLSCNAAHLKYEQHKQQHKDHVKEVMERRWNGTVTNLVAVGSKLADTVENVLNRTAANVMGTGRKIGGVKEGLVTKVTAALAQVSDRWTELRNESSEKMARTQRKMSDAKQKIHDKLAAGAGKLVAKGNELVNYTVGVVTQVVGKLVDKYQQARSKMQQHKAEHNARIVVVPLHSEMSARVVTPAQSVIPVGQIPVEEETTINSSPAQPTYSY